ncbi:hypothetical protein HY491_04690 [Candidatus Woesearchaeota archaeon]|nr:hypothetical protein [Candidatus Woesearchaeota archaeon]
MKLIVVLIALVAAFVIHDIWVDEFTWHDASVVGFALLLLGAAFLFARKERRYAPRRKQASGTTPIE